MKALVIAAAFTAASILHLTTAMAVTDPTPVTSFTFELSGRQSLIVPASWGCAIAGYDHGSRVIRCHTLDGTAQVPFR